MSPIPRNIQLAQASLEHALYFLELGATQRATSYLEFAVQKLQETIQNPDKSAKEIFEKQYPHFWGEGRGSAAPFSPKMGRGFLEIS